MALLQLERIDRYEIIAELGRGAMGVVYQARDPQLERVVALKTLRRDLGLPPEELGELKKRFYQEAKAAGRLIHPNLVAIYDVVEVDDVPYMVMEYVDGCTLAEVIRSDGPLPPERAVPIAVQVCGALHYAHACGVIHRDIKPGNILLDAGGTAKVSDFGIARLAGSQATRTGVLLGTPAYMAPETLGGRPADGRSDLFSLGVSLYEALTGSNPFSSDDLTVVLARIVNETPPPTRERNPTVPPALDEVLARALAKRPEDRQTGAREFGDALERALEPPPSAPRPPRAASRFRGVRGLVVGGLAAVCLVALGLGGRFAWDWWERQQLGAVVVSTDPLVDVLVDGEFKGRTGDGPFVIPEVSVGERSVTLRLGAREWTASGTVRRDQPLAVAHRFPEEKPPPGAKARGGSTKPGEAQDPMREVQDKLRGALDKPRQALDDFRGAMEKLWKTR
jgi:serine/threonine-protein kinase